MGRPLLLIVALVLFVLQAFSVTLSPKVSLGWLGLAFVAAALLLELAPAFVRRPAG
jgi:hypothetical protein